MAGIDLALDVARNVADAVDIGDRGSAEFHDETGHDGLHTGGVGWLQPDPALLCEGGSWRLILAELLEVHSGGEAAEHVVALDAADGVCAACRRDRDTDRLNCNTIPMRATESAKLVASQIGRVV
jgi:hypothetical protein